MNLKAQHARVQLAEQALQARASETLSQTQQLAACWRANLSPGRVIVAGLALGFVVGRARPLQWAGSAGVLTMLRSVSQLFSEVQTQLHAASAAATPDAPPNAPSAQECARPAPAAGLQ